MNVEQARRGIEQVRGWFSPSLAPLVAVCITAALGTTCYSLTNDTIEEDLRTKSAVVGETVSRLVADPLVMGEYARVQTLIAATQQADPDIEDVAVVAKDGEIIASTNKADKRGGFVPAEALSGFRIDKYTVRTLHGGDSFEALTPVHSESSPLSQATLRIDFSKHRVQQVQQGILWRIVLAVILAAAISWSLMKYVASASTQLQDAANILGETVGQILSAIADSLASSKSTADSLNKTTTTVGQLKRTSEVSREQARTVFETAQRSKTTSDVGREAVDQTAAGMLKIRSQMDSSSNNMSNLLRKSQNIGQIITAIDDIARQSTLVSINAAIEAAKAGEHGPGFTAVAYEVRDLATQSKQATAQIRAILSEIQQAATFAAQGTQLSQQIVEGVFGESKQASASITALSDSVSDSANAAAQIASASEQQAQGADQVLTAMVDIQAQAAHNVAVIGRLEAAGKNLSSLEHRLSDLIRQR